MKLVYYSFLIACFISYAASSDIVAQTPSEVITESGVTKNEGGEQTKVPEGSTEDMFLDGVVERNLIHETMLLPYPSLREADVPWTKKLWRVIDTRQKINQPFNYPPNPLGKILLDGVEEGTITAFANEDFTNIVSHTDIYARLNLRDTKRVQTIDPETGKTKAEIKVFENDFDPSSIKRYRVKEVWFFDEGSSRMGVRVLGIAPVRRIENEDGTFLRDEVMFWIYFPEARKYLARIPTFNGFNDSAPMTWADVFDSRRFASFIYKITNVTDTRLDMVHKENPVDMLFESDRIEEELFSMEQDLWSY